MHGSSSNTDHSRRTVAAMYEAAIRGDLASVLPHVHEDVVVLEPAFLAYGGAYRGLEGFQRLMSLIGNYLDFASLRVEQLIADGDRVVAILNARDCAGRPVLLAEKSTLRDGKVVEMQIFYHEAGSLIEGSKGART